MLGENPAERSDTYGYRKIQWFIIFPMKTAIWGVHPGFSDTPQVQNGMIPCQNCKQHQIRVHQTTYTIHVPVSPEMMEKCRLTAG